MRWLLPIVVLASSCVFEIEPCQSDDDCPPQTQCLRPPRTGAPTCIAPDDIEDMGEPTDVNAANNVEDPDDGPNDRPNNQSNIDPPLNNPPSNNTMCPPVTFCGELEPNDLEDDAIYLSDFAQGCAGFGVENWSALHQDTLCAGDVDQFVLEYVACEEGAFRITASLTTPETCAAGGDLEIAEGLWNCNDSNVRCEIQGDVQRIIIIVEEQPSSLPPVEKVRFKVSEGLATSGLEYILRVSVGR